ncbi:MAG: pantetheine-phosphate adenylyltransferase [Gammaproteobacteria bacterium CG11_big_fil_rev_8_21_14_0_20_46_22]|nr:MAG: pantetheine-phosphate adenylyltransferase [Gammaproteobacteria bacterium CG12_big_fil_rev_8_21_14_0_65_46_12]PIR10839.1 MAG: pantetheine-phosphate adenylyltransferase [Gammaproteobacteria bacterium CG11_big_fil_rev_8_21_14_0_20_46_22]
MSKIAVYPGSFDPITLGHINLIERAYHLFDEVIVAVAQGTHKNPLFSLAERVNLAHEALSQRKGVRVEPFEGLLVEFAESHGADVILRGVRGTDDWEYEKQLAFMNKKLSPKLETLFLLPDTAYQHIASSLVKDIARHQGDISSFVPVCVNSAIQSKLAR